MSLKDLIDASVRAQKELNLGKKTVTDIGDSEQALLKQVGTWRLQQGDINSRKAQLDYEDQLKVHQAQLEGIQKFGVAGDGEVLTSLAEVSASADQKVQELTGQLMELNSVSLLDNPVQWFFNQFKTEPVQNQLQAAQISSKNVKDEIQFRQASGTNQAKIQADLAAVVTKEELALSQEKSLVDAKIAASASSLDALKANSQKVSAILNLSNQGLANLFSLESVRRQEEGLKMERLRFNLAQQEAQRRLAKDLKDDKEKADFESTLSSSIQLGRQIRGLAPLGGSDLGISVKNLLSMREKSLHYQDFELGQSTQITGTLRYGATPSEYLKLAGAPGGIRLPEEKKPVHNLIASQARNELSRLIQEPPGKNNPYSGLDPRKEPEKFESAINQISQKLLEGQAKKIVPGSGNIFDIGDLGDWIKKSPGATNLALYQKVLKTPIEAGVKLDKPDQVFAMVTSKLKAGVITLPEALELGAFYKQAAVANAEMKNFEAFGLNYPSIRAGQKTSLTLLEGNFMSSTEDVDLTDPDQLKKAFLVNLANQQFKDVLNAPLHAIQGLWALPEKDQ